MDMDTNWCLICDCYVEGSGPYCSLDCRDKAGPSKISHFYPQPSENYSDDEDYDDDVIYHQVDDAQGHAQWTGNGSAGILAWAAEIPPCSHWNISTPSSSSSSSKTPSPTSLTSRLPKLLRPNQRPAPPALCVTTPRPVVPSPSARPILTPQHSAFCSGLSLGADSMGNNSLPSGATDSSLATPASTLSVPIACTKSKLSVLSTIATHVRSWVAPNPLIASPSSPSQLKDRISPATVKQNEPHKFTIVAHTRHSPALDYFSSFDDSEPAWKLPSTVLVAPPANGGACGHPRARGRKLSRY